MSESVSETTVAWPQIPDPTDIASMRYYLLSRIDVLENHPILIPLTPTDRRVLDAQRRVYQTNDASVSAVLNALMGR